jgi:methylated-DNA-protein-cysteine methyltransferase-like protein
MESNAALTTQRARERAILAAVRAVPRGSVASYGEIARRAGLLGRARLVGRVLRTSNEPRLPWHRITGSQGRIAFATGSAQAREQTQRLQREGLTVARNRVRLPRLEEATLDAAVWAPRTAPSAHRSR